MYLIKLGADCQLPEIGLVFAKAAAESFVILDTSSLRL
jgi:hypothetical protein